jgi:hypothetical protein
MTGPLFKLEGFGDRIHPSNITEPHFWHFAKSMASFDLGQIVISYRAPHFGQVKSPPATVWSYRGPFWILASHRLPDRNFRKDSFAAPLIKPLGKIRRVRSLVRGHFQNSAGGLNVEDYLTPAAIEGPRGGMSAETRRRLLLL